VKHLQQAIHPGKIDRPYFTTGILIMLRLYVLMSNTIITLSFVPIRTLLPEGAVETVSGADVGILCL